MGWICLGALYTTEILPYGIRAKALSVYVFIQTLAIAFNQYVNPVGLESIGWKYYIVFIVLDFTWVVICYFFVLETKGYTLEEVTRLYDGKDVAEDAVNAGYEGEVPAAGYNAGDVKSQDEMVEDRKDSVGK